MESQKPRSCGTCTACCKTPPIFEVQKPAHTWCTQCEIGVGCKIYERRPEPCKNFLCQWMMGYGEETDRPDLIGIIPDYYSINELGMTFILWEYSENALGTERAQQMLIEGIANEIPVLTKPISGQEILYIPQELGVSKEKLEGYANENCRVLIVSAKPSSA